MTKYKRKEGELGLVKVYEKIRAGIACIGLWWSLLAYFLCPA